MPACLFAFEYVACTRACMHLHLCVEGLPERKAQVGENAIGVERSVKNLEVNFHTPLQLEKQVNAISKVCYYRFLISGVSGVICQGMLTNPWPMPS